VTPPRRRLLPLGDELVTARACGLDDTAIRDLDDLIESARSMQFRTVFFIVLRFMARRIAQQQKARSGDGPSPASMAALGRAMDQVARGESQPQGRGASSPIRRGIHARGVAPPGPTS
jgi:hypothetical protein